MKMLKIVIFLMLLFVVQQSGKTQSINYGYDAAGNRTSRSIAVLKSNEPNPADTLVDEHEAKREEILSDVEQVKVYPNPASEQLHIVLPGTSEAAADFWLYNTQGVLVVQGKFEASDNTLSLQEHRAGVYLLLIKNNQKTEQWKILKK